MKERERKCNKFCNFISESRCWRCGINFTIPTFLRFKIFKIKSLREKVRSESSFLQTVKKRKKERRGKDTYSDTAQLLLLLRGQNGHRETSQLGGYHSRTDKRQWWCGLG